MIKKGVIYHVDITCILSLKQDIKGLELRLKHDLTRRMGGMLAATIAVRIKLL